MSTRHQSFLARHRFEKPWLDAWLVAASILLSCVATSAAIPSSEVPGQAGEDLPQPGPTTLAQKPQIALLPLHNRSGEVAPVDAITESLGLKLRASGFNLLPSTDLERFMRRHRIRHTGGLSGERGRLLREETGARVALITTLDLYQERFPPRVGVTCRLITADGEPRILWMETLARAGEEAPGFLGLGIERNAAVILDRLLDRLVASIARISVTAPRSEGIRIERANYLPGRFRPKLTYSSPENPVRIAPTTRVAVLPFANQSTSSYAGEVLADQLVRQVAATGARVLEPGVVRDALLGARVIQPKGPSVPQMDILRVLLDVDVVFYGEVIEYRKGGVGLLPPALQFSFRALDSRSRQVIWSSYSHTKGDRGVFFFDLGEISTVHRLASEMTAGLVVSLASEESDGEAPPATTPVPPTEEDVAEELIVLSGDPEMMLRLIDALKASRLELQQLLQKAQRELGSAQRRLDTSRADRESAGLRTQELEGRLLDQTGERKSMERRLETLERTEVLLKENVRSLGDLLEATRESLADSEESLASSEADRAALRVELEEVETRLQETTEANEELSSQLEAAGLEIEQEEAPAALDTTVSEEVPTDVVRAVQDWAKAWSDQDTDGYVSRYSDAFQLAGGQSLDEWKELRRSRLSQPAFIDLELGPLELVAVGPDRATVTFEQTYRSNTFSDVVRKTLSLALEEDGWKIVREESN